MPTALVTGDAGFIGRHMVKELLQRGYNIHGVDVDPVSDGRNGLVHVGNVVPGYHHFSEDIVRWMNYPKKVEYDLVVHCAAVVGGRETIERKPITIGRNLAIDAQLFKWAMDNRIGRIVYFSSSAAYPVQLQTRRRVLGQTVREMSPRLVESMINVTNVHQPLGMPDLTYGWVKLTGEVLAYHMNRSGTPVHVFRPFSGYGTDQDPSYPFGAFLQRAMDLASPFYVWGDGNQVRDFVHVDDIVGAVFAAIKHDIRVSVNICTGQGTSMQELAHLFMAARGYDAPFEFLGDKPEGVSYRVGDPTLLHTFYVPQVGLVEGIQRAIDSRRQEANEL